MASLKAIQHRVTIASFKCLESKGRLQPKSDLRQGRLETLIPHCRGKTEMVEMALS